ncbi:short chain dehydrogenase reductase family protein [Stylonychia lemnae]|uniref:Short chain dehydrogenase reductase family protein n=1 Tax=Stylonychia lemnae TaxID=5949 RepID=A0A078AHD0_STYLE|nr:short chain dehydrogenase reductase family protein [Stylonychia lemnae]|eukprot:CDW81695.1 short chain dehydrogenase reductase family protein [Stylonychia lemnae]
MICSIVCVLWYVGVLKMLELLYRIIWMIRRALRTTDYLPDRYGKGSWAVVTGGTDGIGLEMAKELSRLGFNIINVARDSKKLKDSEVEIKKTNSTTQIRSIMFDFSKTIKPEDYQSQITDQINDCDVSILINNVGANQSGDFERVPIEKHKEMIDVGIMPGTILTKLLMDKMLKRPKRTAVLFTTSVQVLAPLGGVATYSASKVYLDYLAKSLSHENRHNMDVMTFQCGLVTTKFNGYYKGGFYAIKPQQAAFGALKDLGYEFSSHGHIYHDILAFLMRFKIKFLYNSFSDEMRTKSNKVLEKLSKQN